MGRTDVEVKLQNCGHLMERADSFEETLMLGKIEGGRRRGQQRMRWLDAGSTPGLGDPTCCGAADPCATTPEPVP